MHVCVMKIYIFKGNLFGVVTSIFVFGTTKKNIKEGPFWVRVHTVDMGVLSITSNTF